MDVKDNNLAGQLTLAQGVRLPSWSSLHTLSPGRHLAVSSREERFSFLDHFFSSPGEERLQESQLLELWRIALVDHLSVTNIDAGVQYILVSNYNL